jgi:heme-degrading monooxygenase HmoA
MRADALDAADSDRVTFINRFTVHGPPEEFARVFARTSEFMERQPGFLEHTLLRQVGERTAYINIAYWSNEESLRRAVTQPEFAAHASALRALSTSEPNLYRLSLRRGERCPAPQGSLGERGQ